MIDNTQVRVGVGVFVFRDGKFLIQQRIGAHGEGTWSVPGGHMEFGETPEQTSHREVNEETGCVIKNVRFAAMTNDYFASEGKHYVTWWTMGNWVSGEPTITEPNKCTAQTWVDLDTLPAPLFLPWKELLRSDFIHTIRKELDKTKRKGQQDEV